MDLTVITDLRKDIKIVWNTDDKCNKITLAVFNESYKRVFVIWFKFIWFWYLTPTESQEIFAIL